MIETFPLPKLCHGADVIVFGEVIGVKSVGKAEGNVEVIANLVKVHEPLKGSAAVGEEIKIKTWRGIEDNAVLEKGQRVLLFLKEKDGHFTVYNGVQGWWKTNADGSFAGMGDGKTMNDVKEAIAGPPPASSTYVPIQF